MDRSARMKAISFPFTLDPFGKTASTTDQRKIYQDRVLTLLSTAVGERPMRPTYGTNIATAMFENQGNVEKAINDAIRSAISKWIPELTVNNIFLKGFLDTGAVTVELNVSLPDFIEDNITVVTTTLNPDATTTR
jgi:phage baseplate assembly protein W